MTKKRSTYTIGNFKLKVKRGISGKGLFTESPIPKGACIIEYVGKVVPESDHDTARGRYLFWAGKKKMINGNVSFNPARYINHSCRPNSEATGPDGHIYIKSLRNIKPGEEITYDYGDEYFDEFIKPKGCRCIKCAK